MHVATPRKPHSLFSLFPPPVYLTMPSVGIDISDRTIKFMKLTADYGEHTPLQFGDYPLEQGIVTGGKIIDENKLRDALIAVRKKCDSSFVRASLPEQQAYVFQMNVPEVESEEHLFQTIEFQLEENVPLSPGEAILGYDVLGLAEKEQHLNLTVTAYPKENVELYVKAMEGAGLMPLSLEIESQAIARAVVPRDEQGTYLIVDFGETRTGISILSRTLLAFTSTVEVRGSDLTAAIEEHCGVEKSEIARIKNEQGISAHGDNEKLTEALTKVISALTNELERHYKYWNSNAREGKHEEIKKIILCGGNANVAGLPEFIASRLRAPVERANVWKNAFPFEREVPTMPFEESLSYATAVGLALHRNE